MDNTKKLFEELLKADGIDPKAPTESERAAFKMMLDNEQKRMKRLSWKYVGVMWIFVLAMLGLCLSENILEALHIPLVVAALVTLTAILIVRIQYEPGHVRKMIESNRKISKLNYLLGGKHRGLILVGQKDGSRHIYWLRIAMVAVGLWLTMSLGSASVFYLLCQRWLYDSSPILHIFYCTAFSLSFVIFVLHAGLKTPLDELQGVKTKSKRSKPSRWHDTWRIIMTSRMTKFAALAVIMFGMLIGVSFRNGSSAWAKVIRAFNKVENVHIVQKTIAVDGTALQEEYYLKKPDHLYQDNGESIIIDNGKERLAIDKSKKTAQFSDSFIPFKPLDKHIIFDTVNLFRDNSRKDVEITLLDNMSDEATLVFSLSHNKNQESDLDFRGKAWVDAATMLPKKIQVEQTSEPQKGNIRAEGFIYYEPIPDDVFVMIVPEGFTELPRKVRGVMSGVVLDEQEQPVANAIVYATDRAGQFSEQITTDVNGQFIVKLPPEGAGVPPVWLPVLLRAFVEEVPDKIAWSIIKDPANRHGPGSGREPGGNIPYDVANVENDGCILRSANGIVLRMEPAGAISGQIVDADGNPIPDAKVQLLRCDLSDKHGNTRLTGIDVYKWSSPEELGIVQTDENGWYKLTNLPRLWKRTKIFIHAEAEGFAGDTTSFHLKGPMEYQEVNFQLYQNSLTVTGTLIDNYGKPIEEVPIYAMVNGKRFGSVKTNKKGAFEIKGCPDTSELQIKAELSHNSYPPHEKEKFKSYIYYPDVITGIGYQQDKLEYKVDMIAELPEFTLNVEARDTSGNIVKFFTAEIRGEDGPIPLQWQIDMDLNSITDENGRCTFTHVPNVPGLKVVLCRNRRTLSKAELSDPEKVIAEETMEKYLWGEVPVEIVEGQKEYDLSVVVYKLGEEIDRKNP